MVTTRLIYLFSAWLLAASTAYACSCLPVASTSEAVRNSTFVFAGTVIDKRRFSLPSIADEYKEFRVKIRVIRYWKGELGKTITIRTPAEQSECGFNFEKGKAYIVYASGTKYPEASLCSRTVPLRSSQGESDLKHLGEPKYPS